MIVTCRKKRTSSHQITMKDANNNNISIASADAVRIKLGHDLETPLLDLVSGTPSANGSTVSRANPSTVRFDQKDLDALQPGIYSIEVALVDNSDSAAIKHAERGVFVLESTQGGAVSL